MSARGAVRARVTPSPSAVIGVTLRVRWHCGPYAAGETKSTLICNLETPYILAELRAPILSENIDVSHAKVFRPVFTRVSTPRVWGGLLFVIMSRSWGWMCKIIDRGKICLSLRIPDSLALTNPTLRAAYFERTNLEGAAANEEMAEI